MRKGKHTNEFYQRDAVNRWRASGLSQAAFCRREGITEQQFSNWKCRELRKAEAASKPNSRAKRKQVQRGGIEFAAVDEQLVPEQGNGIMQPAVFVPLVPEKFATAERDTLGYPKRTPVAEICFGDLSVRVWRGADQETMRLIMEAVKEFYRC